MTALTQTGQGRNFKFPARRQPARANVNARLLIRSSRSRHQADFTCCSRLLLTVIYRLACLGVAINSIRSLYIKLFFIFLPRTGWSLRCLKRGSRKASACGPAASVVAPSNVPNIVFATSAHVCRQLSLYSGLLLLITSI